MDLLMAVALVTRWSDPRVRQRMASDALLTGKCVSKVIGGAVQTTTYDLFPSVLGTCGKINKRY